MSNVERPFYVRIREFIAAGILEGRYRDGDALPSVRALAAELGANPLTVSKAYQGFQNDNIIVARRGIGMFVADGATFRLRAIARQRFLERDWPCFRLQMIRLGLGLDDLSGHSET